MVLGAWLRRKRRRITDKSGESREFPQRGPGGGRKLLRRELRIDEGSIPLDST
jgi:hypothetical protein